MAEKTNLLYRMAGTLTNAARKIFEIIGLDMEAKTKSPSPNFWLNSKLGEAEKSLDMIFDGGLSRSECFDKIKELVKDEDEKFGDWLPHKASISLLSAFERDCRARHAPRSASYALATKRLPISRERLKKSQDRLEKILGGGS